MWGVLCRGGLGQFQIAGRTQSLQLRVLTAGLRAGGEAEDGDAGQAGQPGRLETWP